MCSSRLAATVVSVYMPDRPLCIISEVSGRLPGGLKEGRKAISGIWTSTIGHGKASDRIDRLIKHAAVG